MNWTRYPTLISESLGDRLGEERMHLYWRDFHKGLQAGESIFRSLAITRCYNLIQRTFPSHIITLTSTHCQNIFFFHRKAVLEIELTTSTSTSTPPSDSPIASASTKSTFSTTTSTPDLNLNLNDTNPWQTYQVEWTIKVLRYRRMSSSGNVMGVLKSVFFMRRGLFLFSWAENKNVPKKFNAKKTRKAVKKSLPKKSTNVVGG